MMKDFNDHINESIQIKKDLYLYERTINKIIKKIYSTLKSKKKFISVVTEDRCRCTALLQSIL